MSLRMNLYGFTLPSFKQTIGSKDAAILEIASAKVTEFLQEPNRTHGLAWLRTLIHTGHSFRDERVPALPEDGGLLTIRMETETHIAVTHAIARTIATPQHLDFSSESIDWTAPAIVTLHNELMSCQFARSKHCPREYWGWMHRLTKGSPLFGDEFRTDWSYYTVFENAELPAFVAMLKAAHEFTRPLAPGTAEHQAKAPIRLTPEARTMVTRLATWFEQIHHAGQDVFILWW